MSHDYGCTDHPGPSTNCARWQSQTCSASFAAADGPECEISPRNPWGSSVPLYVQDKIVEQPVDHRTLHSRYADAGAAFMGEAVVARKPFLLYVAFSHLHTPIVYDSSIYNTSRRGHYGNAVRELDNTVARLVGSLDTLKVANSTLVLFTGDNGGGDTQCEFGGNNAPFVGEWQREHGGGGTTGKTTTWEGGHREPGLAVWPGHIPAASTSDALVSQLDLFPTLALLAGAALPATRIFDGVDIAPLLFSQRGAASRAFRLRVLAHPNSGEGPAGEVDTVRVGRYKAKWRTGGVATECPTQREGGRRAPLLEHEPPLVFNLYADPAERVALETRPGHIRLGHEDAPRAQQVLRKARDLVRASVDRDASRSVVDWREEESARACCDPTQHMCRCGPTAAAFPGRGAAAAARAAKAAAASAAHHAAAGDLAVVEAARAVAAAAAASVAAPAPAAAVAAAAALAPAPRRVSEADVAHLEAGAQLAIGLPLFGRRAAPSNATRLNGEWRSADGHPSAHFILRHDGAEKLHISVADGSTTVRGLPAVAAVKPAAGFGPTLQVELHGLKGEAGPGTIKWSNGQTWVRATRAPRQRTTTGSPTLDMAIAKERMSIAKERGY